MTGGLCRWYIYEHGVVFLDEMAWDGGIYTLYLWWLVCNYSYMKFWGLKMEFWAWEMVCCKQTKGICV